MNKLHFGVDLKFVSLNLAATFEILRLEFSNVIENKMSKCLITLRPENIVSICRLCSS